MEKDQILNEENISFREVLVVVGKKEILIDDIKSIYIGEENIRCVLKEKKRRFPWPFAMI